MYRKAEKNILKKKLKTFCQFQEKYYLCTRFRSKMGWEPSSLTDLHETVVVQEAINFFWLRDFLFKSTDTVILNQTNKKIFTM